MIRRGPIILLAALFIGFSPWAVGENRIEAASVIARTCVTCHHPENRDIPSVPGDMDKGVLAARLIALRKADETVTVMHRLMAGIDENDIPSLTRVLMERP